MPVSFFQRFEGGKDSNILGYEVNSSFTRKEQRDPQVGKILSDSSLAIIVAVACLQRKASNYPENKNMPILPFCIQKGEMVMSNWKVQKQEKSIEKFSGFEMHAWKESLNQGLLFS